MEDVTATQQERSGRWPGRSRWLLGVELAAVVGGYLVAVLAAQAGGGARWALLALGAVCVGVPVVVQARRQRAAQRAAETAEQLAVEYEERLATALGDMVTPIADLLGSIAQARGTDRTALQAQLKQAVVDAAAQLCGPERTRAVLFELDGDVLRPGPWTGRGDEPVTVFRRGADRRGDAAHALVARRGYVFVPDVDAERLPTGVDVRRGAVYRAFLSVAVGAGAERFGMLTVDATEAGSLDKGDLRAARALAYLLGAGLAGGSG